MGRQVAPGVLGSQGSTSHTIASASCGASRPDTTAAELYKDMLAADLKRIARDEKLEEAERMDILFGKLSGNVRVDDPSQSKQAAPKRRGIISWLLGR
ncbi:hypothetical protein AB4Z25_27260 [Rhizobium sp. RAF36]|uniref:hypothetical protein n=1 Tax=Rhizobium sp. RAF36 TaxID=3233055 RepID=UPI003F989754